MNDSWFWRALTRTPLPWMIRNSVSRRDVIQRCIDARKARTYLEIGVSEGRCFSQVRAPVKIGVDPIPAAPLTLEALKLPGVSYFARTSDSFFESEAPEALKDGVQVVFIDGLHTWAQAYRDCVNALRYLSPGGIVLLHDCLPKNEFQAIATDSPDEVPAIARARGFPMDSAWTGDVWKAIVALRQHPDLATCVLHTDRGVGVVRRGPREPTPHLTEAEIGELEFSDLRARRRELLGLRKPHHLRRILADPR